MTRRQVLHAVVGAVAIGVVPGCSGLGGSAAREPHEIGFVILPGVLPFTSAREVLKTYEAWADEFAGARWRRAKRSSCAGSG